MSFNSSHHGNDSSDDADSDHGNASHNGTLDEDGGSSEYILPNQSGSWKMKYINTGWVGGILIILTLALIYVTAVIVTVECRSDPPKNNDSHVYPSAASYVKQDRGVLCYVPPVSLIMYLQSLLWGVFLICDQYLQYEHIKARRRGYLEFYNETRLLSQLPFFIVTAWCALLLTVSTVLHDNCRSEDECGQAVHLGKAEYALIFVGLEGILIITVFAVYIYKIHRFNKSQELPDVLKEDYMSMATDYNPNSVGQVDEEIFQRQADVIRYLSEHNVILRRKVMELNRQLMEQSHTHSV